MRSTFVFTNLSIALLVLSAQGFSLSDSYKSAKKSKEADTVYGDAGGNIPSHKADPKSAGNYRISEGQNKENSSSGYYIINAIKNQSQKIKRYISSQQKNYERSKKMSYNRGSVQSANHQTKEPKSGKARGVHGPISSKVSPGDEQSKAKERYGGSPGKKGINDNLIPEKPYKKAFHHSKRSELNGGYPADAKNSGYQNDIKGQDSTKQHTEYTNKINDSNESYKNKHISAQGHGKPQENLYPVYSGAHKAHTIKNNQENNNRALNKARKSNENNYRTEKSRQRYIKKRTAIAQEYLGSQQKVHMKDNKNHENKYNKYLKYSLRHKQQEKENRYNHRNQYNSKQNNGKVNKKLGSNGESDNYSSKSKNYQLYNNSETKNTVQRAQTDKKVARTKLYTPQKRQVSRVASNQSQVNNAAVNQNDKNELINSLAEILKQLESVLDSNVLEMLPGLGKVISDAKEAVESVKDSAVDALLTPTSNTVKKPKVGTASEQVDPSNKNAQVKNGNAQPVSGSLTPEKSNDITNSVINPKIQQSQQPTDSKVNAPLSINNSGSQNAKDTSTNLISPQIKESSNVQEQGPVKVTSNAPAAQRPLPGSNTKAPSALPSAGSANPASPAAPPSISDQPTEALPSA
ncbi:hypothetical protein AYI70_g83, partial [Smittium culicis]